MSAARIIPYNFTRENRIFLASGSEFRRSSLANILRGHAFQVDVARDLTQARLLWRPNTYAWILVDVAHQLPGEVLDFREQIKRADPRQQIAFLVGPPRFVSLNWPEETLPGTKPGEKLREFTRRLPRAA
jgi:hypothetical protein